MYFHKTKATNRNLGGKKFCAMHLKAYLAEDYQDPRTKPLPEKTTLHNAKIMLFTIYLYMQFIGTSEKKKYRFNNKSIIEMETAFMYKYILRNNNNIL